MKHLSRTPHIRVTSHSRIELPNSDFDILENRSPVFQFNNSGLTKLPHPLDDPYEGPRELPKVIARPDKRPCWGKFLRRFMTAKFFSGTVQNGREDFVSKISLGYHPSQSAITDKYSISRKGLINERFNSDIGLSSFLFYCELCEDLFASAFWT